MARRLRQPQGAPRINWANPLTRRGLVRCIVFNVGGAPLDLVTGTRLTVVSAANIGPTTLPAARSTGPGALGQKNTSESGYWTLPVRTETSTSLSVGWVGSMQGGTLPAVMRDNTSSGGTILLWSSSGWRMRAGGSDYTPPASPAFNNNTVYAAVCTSSPAGVAIFVDGAPGLTSSTTAVSALTSPWYIHQNGPNAQGALATSALLVIWDQPLSSLEAEEFERDPWQLLEWLPAPSEDGAPAPSGANFTAGGSGRIQFGGSATASMSANFAASGAGGLQFGGAASSSQSSNYAASGAGGIVFGGAASAMQSANFAAGGSGGIQFGGSAEASVTVNNFNVTGSGGIVFAGSATLAATAYYTATGAGGIIFGGSADALMAVAGAPSPAALTALEIAMAPGPFQLWRSEGPQSPTAENSAKNWAAYMAAIKPQSGLA